MARLLHLSSPGRKAGFSLAEVAVMLGVMAVLMAVAVPAYSRYRGHIAVNTAAEVTEGLLVRAREEARASGFPLPDSLRGNGVPEAAPSEPLGGNQGGLVARLRKRTQAGAEPTTLLSRELSPSAPLELQAADLGRLDLDTDTSLQGVYFELLLQTAEGQQIVATIPVDVNGEMALHGAKSEAAIHFVHKSYARSLKVTRRGVVTPDRR